MDNANSPEYLTKIQLQVLENLRRTAFAPSVQMKEIPRSPLGDIDESDAVLDDLDEDETKDRRWSERKWDTYTEKDGELYSDDEDDQEQKGSKARPNSNAAKRRKRNATDHRDDVPAQDGSTADLLMRNGIATNRAHSAEAAVNPAIAEELLNSKAVTSSHSGEADGEGGPQSSRSSAGSSPDGDHGDAMDEDVRMEDDVGVQQQQEHGDDEEEEARATANAPTGRLPGAPIHAVGQVTPPDSHSPEPPNTASMAGQTRPNAETANVSNAAMAAAAAAAASVGDIAMGEGAGAAAAADREEQA